MEKSDTAIHEDRKPLAALRRIIGQRYWDDPAQLQRMTTNNTNKLCWVFAARVGLRLVNEGISISAQLFEVKGRNARKSFATANRVDAP
jgi:hypothetical protein